MTTIVTRAAKGSALSWTEVDANFTNLNTAKLELNASGNLGIGTASPNAKLVVSDAGTGFVSFAPADAATSLVMRLGYNADYSQITADSFGGNLFIGADESNTKANSYIAFRIDASEKMRLDASGNLGLGVTPSAWATYPAMQLGGAGVMGAGSDLNLSANGYFNAGWKRIATGAATLYNQSAGVHSWYNAGSGSAGTAISLTQAMTLDASGNLGVGTSSVLPYSPSYRVAIVDGGANPSAIQLNNTTTGSGTNSGGLLLLQSGNDSYIWNPKSSFLSLGTANTERMRIDSSGNVGIGTSSLSNKFTVLVTDASAWSPNSTNSTQMLFNNGVLNNASATTVYQVVYGDSTTGGVKVGAVASGSYSADFVVANRNGGTYQENLRVTASGNVGIGTTSPTAKLDVNDSTIRVRTAKTPASATAAGNAGDICWDSNYVYVCVATNTWKRSALSTW